MDRWVTLRLSRHRDDRIVLYYCDPPTIITTFELVVRLNTLVELVVITCIPNQATATTR